MSERPDLEAIEAALAVHEDPHYDPAVQMAEFTTGDVRDLLVYVRALEKERDERETIHKQVWAHFQQAGLNVGKEQIANRELRAALADVSERLHTKDWTFDDFVTMFREVRAILNKNEHLFIDVLKERAGLLQEVKRDE